MLQNKDIALLTVQGSPTSDFTKKSSSDAVSLLTSVDYKPHFIGINAIHGDVAKNETMLDANLDAFVSSL